MAFMLLYPPFSTCHGKSLPPALQSLSHVADATAHADTTAQIDRQLLDQVNIELQPLVAV